MRLLIDVGNTSLKAVLWHNQQAYPTDINNLPWAQIDEVVYACVGRSDLLSVLLTQAAEYNIQCYEAYVSRALQGLTCAYEQVDNLGIDRWLAVIAGFTLYPNEACIIVDAGTATTIDVLNDHGEHLGGWILPGLDLMTTSLTKNTQRVFDDETTPFANQLGKTMRRSPEDAPSPMVPIIIPRPAATIPLMATRPARIPTIDRPKIVIIRSSGVRNSSTIGRATRMKTVKSADLLHPPA